MSQDRIIVTPWPIGLEMYGQRPIGMGARRFAIHPASIKKRNTLVRVSHFLLAHIDVGYTLPTALYLVNSITSSQTSTEATKRSYPNIHDAARRVAASIYRTKLQHFLFANDGLDSVCETSLCHRPDHIE